LGPFFSIRKKYWREPTCEPTNTTTNQTRWICTMDAMREAGAPAGEFGEVEKAAFVGGWIAEMRDVMSISVSCDGGCCGSLPPMTMNLLP
jgi:hypothetical protein